MDDDLAVDSLTNSVNAAYGVPQTPPKKYNPDANFKQIFLNGSDKKPPTIEDLQAQIDNKKSPDSDLDSSNLKSFVNQTYEGTQKAEPVHVEMAGIPKGLQSIKDASDQAGGVVESVLHYGSKLGAQALGGVTGLIAGGYSGFDPDEMQRANQSVQDKLTYQPIGEAGKKDVASLNDSAGRAYGRVMGLPGIKDVSGGYNQVADAVGGVSPVAGTFLHTVPRGVAALGIPEIGGEGGLLSRSGSEANPSNFERVEPSLNGSAAAPAGESTMSGGGAAVTNNNAIPRLSGQEDVRGNFPQIKTTKTSGDAPPAEQQARAAVVNEVMGNQAGTARTGVITGNEQTLRSEHTLAKNPEQSPAAAVLAKQIATEQQALSKYAQDRVEATGADPTLTAPEQRGEVINNAFHGEDSLSSYFKDVKQAIFQHAKDQVGDKPMDTSGIDAGLADPAFQATVQFRGHEGVVNGAERLINLAKTTGLKDPVTGEMLAPGSISAMQAVTKKLNADWTPDKASTIRDINGMINDDIAKSGGEGLYQLGNKVHALEKGLTEAPGMEVFGQVGRNGIKEGTPVDKIGDKLNKMPTDQWQHIDATLDKISRGQIPGAAEGMLPPVPQSVMDSAARARAEMHGELAREVYKAGAAKVGVWNQNSANAVLNGRVGAKISSTFPPEEVQNFHNLNVGGQIMPGVHSYEGAALQGQRLESQPGFIEKYSPSVASAAGHVVKPGLGGMAGEAAGNFVAKVMAKNRINNDAANIEKTMRNNSLAGATPLRNLINQEPK